MRVGFRTGITSPRVFADAAFGPVERRPIESVAGNEAAPPTAPLHRYVSLFNDSAGATVFSDGLAEYEASADGTLWVTLVRAVGELSRHDLPERPGHAGYPVPTPLAQGLGPFEARFGFAQHGPRVDSTIHLIERLADDVLLPLRGEPWRTAINPAAHSAGPALVGQGLAFSTMKESEDGEWVVLRCVNLLDHAVEGGWQLPAVREAFLSRLDETPLEGLPVQGGGVRFMAAPRAVITILVR
jgi:alpha-mannosidase